MVRAISPTHSSYGFSIDLLFLQFSIESIPLLIPFLLLGISRILYSPAPKQQLGLFMMHTLGVFNLKKKQAKSPIQYNSARFVFLKRFR